MKPASVTARLMFALAEADARIRWELGQLPAFDAQLAPGPFTTLVGFLPEAFAADLAEFIAAFPTLAEHYCYPPTQMHVTVRNLDRADLAELPVLLEGVEPIRLRAIGLGFTRETLLLRMLAADRTLRRLRIRLDGLRGIGPGRLARRDLAFANVLRLNGPVAGELRRAVSVRRQIFAGRVLELDRLTLIRTDKVGSPARSEVLDQYSLAAVP